MIYVTRWVHTEDGMDPATLADEQAGFQLYVTEQQFITERTAREAAEAAVARMREGVAEMVGVMKREAQRRKAAGQHEAAAMLEDRANELRALLEGRRYSEDAHG